MEIIRNAVAFIFVIGILVFVHELGHFLVAKWNKMYVYQFCLGLGPKILKYKGKETTYAICLFPIGGMVDLREDDTSETDERSFSAKKPWQRFLTIIAGATMNFILAFILIFGIFTTTPLQTTTVAELTPDMPAAEVGIEVGDTIVEVNGEKITFWNDVINNIVYSENTEFEVVVDRNGEELTYQIVGKELDGFIRIGVAPVVKKDFIFALKYSAHDFVDKSTLIFDAFAKLVTGRLGADQIGGPVAIYKQVGEVAATNSIANLLYFTALLSINLGIFNLLPVPFLDGGRAMFILYEMIFRKPVNKEKEAMVHFAGMVLLVGLMVFLIVKDLVA